MAIRTPLLTNDGSYTIYHSELNEIYHSRHGALTESQHVFIHHGLLHQLHKMDHIALLEVGYGTGLNVLLTIIELQNPLHATKHIEYTGIEKYPLEEQEYVQLHYPSILQHTHTLQWFEMIHHSQSNSRNPITPNFFFTPIHTGIEAHLAQITRLGPQYNLIYFDAFGPNTQSELWTASLFKQLYEVATLGAVLVTYCAKGAVRRAMQEAGWTVERLAGPPGKREMIRATK